MALDQIGTTEDIVAHYVQMFGEMPPVPRARLRAGMKHAPDATLAQERLRIAALEGGALGAKVAQIIAFVCLSAHAGPGCEWHARAAIRAGASRDELYAALQLAFVFHGMAGLTNGGLVLSRLYEDDGV